MFVLLVCLFAFLVLLLESCHASMVSWCLKIEKSGNEVTTKVTLNRKADFITTV